MAASTVVSCAADAWTLVKTGTTSVTIHRLSVAPNLYKQAIVLTGVAAPTDDSTAALMFSDSPNEEIVKSSVPIDYYVKAVKNAGSVRVDG